MAVVLCRKCLKRLPDFHVLSTRLLVKYLTSQSAQANQDIDTLGFSTEHSSHISRDKLKVLNALASTIQPVHDPSLYGFFEDPFLMPRNRTRKNEIIKAREEGKKAAEYIIKTYPDFFPLRKPEPEWPEEFPAVIQNVDEETLLNVIETQQKMKAIRLYEKLVSKGERVSLDCENKLLELTGYYGTKLPDSQNEQTENKSPVDARRRGKWSSQNFASQLFEKMSTKNGTSYEVMILSLLKFHKYKLALKIYDEMKSKALKGSVFLYNKLIERSEELYCDKTDPWTFAQEIVKQMNRDHAVKPNVGTFISLLKVCASHSPEAREDALKMIREMYSLNIEPSLGCYYYLLDASERKYKGHEAVLDIIAHLKSLNHQFTPQSPSDWEFFASAMSSARHYQDNAAARELFEISKSGNFKVFIGPTLLSFYGNLLCSLAFCEHPNAVMDMYHQLVPKYFVPREWIYVELFHCLEKNKQPHRSIELYNDIRRFRVNMAASTFKSIFSCFSVKLAKEHLPEYIKIMEEILEWMEFFDVELENFMISQMIRIYCLNGQLDAAWQYMEKFSEKNFVPNFAALSSLLQGTLSTKEKEKAKEVLRLIATQEFKLSTRMRNAYYRELQFTPEECHQIDKLFPKKDRRRKSLR